MHNARDPFKKILKCHISRTKAVESNDRVFIQSDGSK